MAIKLLGRTGHVAGRDVCVTDHLSIGASEDSDFRLVLRGVSRNHARIMRDGSSYWLEDAGSTNGTYLNGQRISRERLQHLDVITLGRDMDLITVFADDPTAGTMPARAVTDASLEWVDGADAGARLDIPLGELTLGRLAPSNVLIDSPVVSQLHARIQRTADHVSIQDLESSNGTFVNSHRITTATVLRDGDTVSVAGSRQFRVHIAGDAGRVRAGVEDAARLVGR
jgi:pSer/pThr/pTyr-binding forkhead associated (FHA) protein